MLSILLEVQKDETFLKQMFDISAITPLVKWYSDFKNSIGHFSPSEIEGIKFNEVDVCCFLLLLLLFGEGLFTEILNNNNNNAT